MQNLTRAQDQLFRRTPDEQFDTLQALVERCHADKQSARDRWHLPDLIRPDVSSESLNLQLGSDGAFLMNDWSFGQLCKLARVKKDTINRLSVDTAHQVFRETLPSGNKPMQILTNEDRVRSIHAASYTRLFNTDVLNVIQEFATDFRPPQKAAGGGTGLYCGEQDMFCFLIDPTGWAEIEGETFAPGFFVWNSEVGRRSLGIQTFWFQAVCANHIVWDAVEVVEFSRKHTAKVHEALNEIRSILERLVAKRDERRDGFVEVVRKAMVTKLGEDAEEVAAVLAKQGIPKGLAGEALAEARRQGRFTIFALVDALTRLGGNLVNAGDRIDVDARAAGLLALAA